MVGIANVHNLTESTNHSILLACLLFRHEFLQVLLLFDAQFLKLLQLSLREERSHLVVGRLHHLIVLA